MGDLTLIVIAAALLRIAWELDRIVREFQQAVASWKGN
jgi:hypothetical protein